jgi:hypothetical protein
MNEKQTTEYAVVPMPEPNYDALFGGFLVLLIMSVVVYFCVAWAMDKKNNKNDF